MNRTAQALASAVKLHKDGQFEQATAAYERLLKLEPNYAEAWANYAVLLRQTGRRFEALCKLQHANLLKKDDEIILTNLADTYADNGDYKSAIDTQRTLLRLGGESTERLFKLSVYLNASGNIEEAIALIDQAEQRNLADAACITVRGMSRLRLGDYRRGFEDFESRFIAGLSKGPRELPWPRWQGESASGKRLLIYPEQGLGDDIFAARFFPLLVERGFAITTLVRPPLRRLFDRLHVQLDSCSTVNDHKQFDAWVPAGSLAHCLVVSKALPPARFDAPAAQSLNYSGDDTSIARKLKIGLCWQGNLDHPLNHLRSVPLEHFQMLAEFDQIELISLQKEYDPKQIAAAGLANRLVDGCSDDRDLADAAALIEQLDLVITADTVIAHLAASLNRRTWVLLNRNSHWYFGDQAEITPWYPSMRLYRQELSNDWQPVMQNLREDLARMLTSTLIGHEDR